MTAATLTARAKELQREELKITREIARLKNLGRTGFEPYYKRLDQIAADLADTLKMRARAQGWML